MTFTYNLADDLGQMRFELGDTNETAGVRADGSNLSDAELQFLLDREGSVSAAVAAACEMLSRDWAKAASYTTGPRSEQLGKVGAEWAQRAADLRSTLGGSSSSVSISVPTRRVDGYSEAAQ